MTPARKRFATMTISTILFDLDDTLMPEMAPEEESFLAACALVGERDGDPKRLYAAVDRHGSAIWEAFEANPFCECIGMAWWEGLWATFEGRDPHYKLLRDWAPAYRQQVWTQALTDLEIDDPDFALQLSNRYQEERAKRHTPYPDAAEVLEDLRKDFKLGMLTNGASDVQRTKLDGSGLKPYFEAVLVTGDIGIGKPDPKPFEVLLERLGVEAREAAMVGNSLTSDVQGALNAGVKSIWLNLDDSWAEDGITPDVEIGSLGEIRLAVS